MLIMLRGSGQKVKDEEYHMDMFAQLISDNITIKFSYHA